MDKLQTLDYTIIIFMLVLSSAVGIYFRFTGGRQKTIDEYLMGNKKMSMFPVSISLMASYMSATSILGVPSETYLYGTQYSMSVLGAVIGSAITIYGFLPAYFNLNINSVNEYLGTRFGSKTRTIVAVFQILRTIFYTAVALYSPSLALNAITGISIWTATISMTCVCTFYCTLGGVKAVLWTDIFQAILMYTTLIAVIVGGIQYTGFFEMVEKSKKGGRFIFFDFSSSLTERYTFWNCVIYGMFLNVTAFGTSQTGLQRIFSISKLGKAQWSVLLATIYNSVFIFMCIWCGIVLSALYENCDPILNSNEQQLSPDKLVPLTIMTLFSNISGLAGLCVAGIFSASLSTISSAINALTSVTVEDFLKPYLRSKYINEPRMACIAKVFSFLYGVFCLLLSFMAANFRGILEANTIMGGMIGGPIVGIFILGMFYKYLSEVDALIGLILGFAFGIWAGFGTFIVKAEIETLPRSVNGCTSNETMNNEEFFGNASFAAKEWNESFINHSHEKGYIFPLYEIAYFWVPVFACLITITSGVASSFFASCFLKKGNTQHQKLGLLIRKFNFKTKTKYSYKSSSQNNLVCETIESRSFQTFENNHMDCYGS